MSSYLNQLLRDKLPESAEIEIHYSEFCNLNCSFCGQDHDSKVGLDTSSMLSKIEIIKDFMDKTDKDSFIVNIMGGEIFNDEIPDSVFVDYKTLGDSVIAYGEEIGASVRINWVTNLIFSKWERVEALIRSVPYSHISTSYDFSGRGLNIIRTEQWKRNLEIFSDHLTVIGFVLTKPAIRKLLRDADNEFKELYAKYPLYFDFYVPEKSAAKMMPTEQDMLDAYLFIAKHYPLVNPIHDMITKADNKLTCYSLEKLTILPDNRVVTCRYVDYPEGEFNNPVDYSSNENIIESHIYKYDCFSCEYFQRCSMRCFVQADWSRLKKLPDCLNRTFFREYFNN